MAPAGMADPGDWTEPAEKTEPTEEEDLRTELGHPGSRWDNIGAKGQLWNLDPWTSN